MRLPEAFEPLVDHGVLDEVVRPLMSGKEAMVYLVISEGRECVAKVYKDAQQRSFKNRAEYTEGRQVRNTRDQRAMSKRSAYGRARDEAAWKSTEVDMIYRLAEAGVRVPHPYWFVEGVLLMELVTDAEGRPAQRLGELVFTPEDAQLIFEVLLADVVRMLHAGVVHGDLSEFNVLMAADGPVIIDFPQAINAAGNQNARKMLLRDVDNLHRFASRFIRGWPHPPYAEEMWDLYERGELRADSQLTGKYVRPNKQVHVRGVMDVIDDARYDERQRRQRSGQPMQGGPRNARPSQASSQFRGGGSGGGGGRGGYSGGGVGGPRQQTQRSEPGRQQPQDERRPYSNQQPQGERRSYPSQQPRRDSGGPPQRTDGRPQGPRNDQRGNAPRNDQRGNAPRNDQRGNAPRNDQRGNAPRNDQRGNAPRNDQRGNAPRNDQRGNAPRNDQRGHAPRSDQRDQRSDRRDGPPGRRR